MTSTKKTQSDILNAFRRDITLGRHAIGDRLPSLAEIGRNFGVSQSMVREALGVLQAEGLVEIRRGRDGGVFVSDQTPEAMAHRLMTQMLAKQVSVAQVRDLRLLLEVNACRVGGLSAPPAVLQTMRRLTDDMENCTDTMRHMRLNEDFHVLIGELGNNIYGIILRPLLRFMSYASKCMTPDQQVIAYHRSSEHYGIINAIEAGDPERACGLLRNHIMEAYHRYTDQEKKFLEQPLADFYSEARLGQKDIWEES